MKLRNSLVSLRPVRLSDAPRYVKWFSDVQVTRNLRQQRVTLQKERKWIKMLSKSKASVVFAIDTAEGIHIGSIGLHHIDDLNHTGEYGIIIGDKRCWGRGYGRAASELILNYGFERLKLNRIWLSVYEFNERGKRLYRKLGFRKEGVQRQYVRRNGRYHDAVLMGILVNEWRKKRKKYAG